MIKTWFMVKHAPKVIAHRGASTEAVENTLDAFQIALDLKVDGIELDLHLSRDLVPVCFHDAYFFKDCSKLYFRDLTYEEIVDKTRGHYKIPTLDEILALDLKKTTLMLELKASKRPKALVDQVLKRLKKAGGEHVIGSQSFPMLRYLRTCWPAKQTVSIVRWGQPPTRYLPFSSAVLAPKNPIVNKELVKLARENSARVWVWTVNDVHRAEQLFDLGVEGVITDNPREILKLKS